MAGRTALVTGATQGIGREIAHQLARDGATVAVNGRDQEKLDRTVRELVMAGGSAVAAPASVRDSAQVRSMVDSVMSEFGHIDFLVNNAGISAPAPFVDLTEEDWDLQIGTNLTGTFLCSQAVARHMVRAGHGAIVNVCSIAAFGGQEGRAGYAASKAGMLGLTRVMAQELGPHRIRVNAVAPGLLTSDMIEKIVPPQFRQDIVIDRNPTGRMGTAAEVAEVVLFLLSDGAAYISGEAVVIDGGLLSGYFYSGKAIGASYRRSVRR